MSTFHNIISAIADFLDEAKNHGLIKEFSVIESSLDKRCKNEQEADQLISKFLKIINEISMPTENRTSPATESMEIMENAESEAIDVVESPVKKNLVQIQVDETEIKRRISAFISRKRKEVDEWNVQEFCSRPYVEDENPVCEEMDSCARVDTVFVPRSGSKSHVKVSKVQNRWGPQTHLQSGVKKIKQEPNEGSENIANDAYLEAMEERLQNMESHLKLKTESSLRTNIFRRLKDLEDRILFLEGISPDYFHMSGTDFPSPKKKSFSEKEKLYFSWSSDDLEKRIQTLKDSLRMKALQVKSEPPE